MRGFRFSLFTKTMLWFFLNLLILGAVLFFIFNLDFRFAPRSPFFRESANRIEALSRLVSLEMSGETRAEQDRTLAKYGEVYKIEFLVYDEKGEQLAGKEKPLPPQILDELAHQRFERPPPPPADVPENERLPRLPPPPGGPPIFAKTDDPTLFWSGSRMLFYDKNKGEPINAVLMTVSDSPSGRGFFFNPTPWLVIGGIVVLGSILFWLPFVRGITKNIGQMTRATEQIAAEKFDARVSETRTDELGRLGAAINRMAEKLAGFVYGQKRFLGDISHELNSPLARLQLSLSVMEDYADDKTQTYLESAKEEVELMTKLVNELLTFSKAGMQAAEIKLESVVLRPLVESVVGRENKTDQAEFVIAIDENLRVAAHGEMLARAISNVVRNAIRYAGDHGKINIAAHRENSQTILTIADNGTGVPESQIGRLFDPFYRVEAHRSRETGGSGLGLAIVKTCVEACGGKVSARNLKPRGLEVEISLENEKRKTENGKFKPENREI